MQIDLDFFEVAVIFLLGASQWYLHLEKGIWQMQGHLLSKYVSGD